MKLYEIVESMELAIAMAREEAEENGGEISDATAQALDSIEMEQEEKVGNICRLIKNKKAEADAIKAEADKLAKRAKTASNEVDSLRAYLQNWLPNTYKYSDSTSKLSFRRSESVSVEVDAKFLPEGFFRETVSYAADKTAIKEALKDGTEIKGCSIVESFSAQVK